MPGSNRYVVPNVLSGLDAVEISLADGRVIVIGATGDVSISRQGEFPMAGYARIQLPDPELSSSDHEGYRWEAVKTRRRH